MEKYDLQKLRELPIEAVAGRLGLQVTHHKALCPFHDDHHASLSFRLSKNTYRCFVCGASGGTIDLAMKCLNKDFRDACQWLHSLSSLEGCSYNSNGISSLPSREGAGVGLFDATRYERFFLRPYLSPPSRHFLFEERRLDERVVRWCRLTSWKDRNGVDWLQIPYYDRDGKLIGIQNRRLKSPSKGDSGDLPRFRFPRGSQCGIYNLPVLNLLKPGEALYITEGCSDCWAMLSAGHKAIAIPSATLLTQKDVELLNGLCSSPFGEAGRGLSFHMFPDRDAPGERLFLQLQQVLPNLVHHQLPLGCKDFSDYYLSTLNHKP